MTAAINVDDEIVHGTASVHHSQDSPQLDPTNAGGMIKVRHYLQDEGALPERAHSQVECHSNDALGFQEANERAKARD